MKAAPLNRTNSVLLCGILICVVLYYARQVLIPVTAAAMLAMLVTPLATWLEEKGMKRVFSSLVGVLLFLTIIGLVLTLVIMQGKQLASQAPQMQEKITELQGQMQGFIYTNWNIPPEKQSEYVQKQVQSVQESAGSTLKKFVTGLTGVTGGIVLIIVFMFLFLLQREKYEAFLLKLYKGNDVKRAQEIIQKTSKVAQYYLIGRLISIAILTALFTAGLMIVGVKNAFLLSFIAAILTIVPYVGSLIGGLFPFLVALVTSDTTTALWALGVILFVQSIDNYFIEPYVVGGEVNISAFFTILILVIGGLVWGIAGMILFIPLLGIAKIIFDNMEELEPYGYLIGDQQEGRQSGRMWTRIKQKLGIKG